MGKRTSIFSIFVLLCLLPNSIYARTIEYEAKRDTTLDLTIYFDQNARQVDKDYQGNSKTLALLDSLLANPVHTGYLHSIILVSPDLYNGIKEQDTPLGQKRSEEVKAFLYWKYPQVDAAKICIRKGEEYGAALRKLIVTDGAVPDREDVLALIDYHHDNPAKMQDFLQHLDAGIPYRYISSRLLPELRRTEISICLSYPEEAPTKKPSTELTTVIEETDFTPIDRETVGIPLTVPIVPQKERAQAIVETKKTTIKAEKKKETKEKRGKAPKEKAEKRDKTADNTVLALKNNLLYDLALAPNIEIEVPIGRRWSVNAEYKSPWWSNSSEEFCYQLISGGIESRYWLGNRQLHNPLNGHFFGLYVEGGIYDFQFKGDGYQGKYYGAAGLTYGYSTPVSRHLAFEFSLGIGYLTTEYQKYTPYEGSLVWMSSGKYNFIGPTKAKISLVWLITKRRERK